jgi:hypothetical protein
MGVFKRFCGKIEPLLYFPLAGMIVAGGLRGRNTDAAIRVRYEISCQI